MKLAIPTTPCLTQNYYMNHDTWMGFCSVFLKYTVRTLRWHGRHNVSTKLIVCSRYSDKQHLNHVRAASPALGVGNAPITTESISMALRHHVHRLYNIYISNMCVNLFVSIIGIPLQMFYAHIEFRWQESFHRYPMFILNQGLVIEICWDNVSASLHYMLFHHS